MNRLEKHMANNREDGYYWVAWYTDNDLMVAKWNAGIKKWLLDGTDDLHSDKSFTYISSKKIPKPDISELVKNPRNNSQ